MGNKKINKMFNWSILIIFAFLLPQNFQNSQALCTFPTASKTTYVSSMMYIKQVRGIEKNRK